MAYLTARMNDHCKELASFSITNFVFSIVILLGILLSYLPQHYRIIARRTSFGISPYFVLLGTTAGTSGFANILVLPRSARDIACCKEIDGLSCLSALLGIFQIGTQTLGFAIILVLFILYYPHATPVHVSKDSAAVPPFRTALAVVALCIAHALATTIFAATIVLAYPSSRQLAANVLGIIAAVLASIQYLPQIYTTYRLKRVASLSIPMMCIQTPGGFMWAASLAARLGPEGWSTWSVYLLTASLQGVVLALGIYFEYIRPRKVNEEAGPGLLAEDVAEDDGPAEAPSEETPLLRSSD